MKFLFVLMILFVVISEHLMKTQELLFKNFARSNRGSRGPDEFEKFFLKASKSVPRIGRRDFDMEIFHKNRQYCLTADMESRMRPRCLQILNKKYDPEFLKDISWYDLAEKIEYNPEILMSPGFLTSAGFKELDDPYENKRKVPEGLERNKEITEFRLQPDS